MRMIARTIGYDDVLNAVKGKTVAIWTCGTCAKLCNNIGGKEAADRLADKLRADGVNVSASLSISAACLMSKVNAKASEIPDGTDLIISLTCDTGVMCAYDAFDADIMSPLVTIGNGFMDSDGKPMVAYSYDEDPETLDEAAKKKGMTASPFV